MPGLLEVLEAGQVAHNLAAPVLPAGPVGISAKPDSGPIPEVLVGVPVQPILTLAPAVVLN